MRQFLDPVLRAGRFFGRYEKPRYYSSDGTTIIVPGSSGAPIMLVIAGRVYESTGNMECNINRSGEDGMNRVTVAANTPYYLYAIIGEDGIPHLIADIQEPARGPQGYSEWTYIGSFATDLASAAIDSFQSAGGILISSDDIELEGHTGDLVSTSYELSSLPVTAIMAYGFARHNGAGAVESYVIICGASSGDGLVVRSQVANVTNYSFGWVPILTEKTIWIALSDAATQGRFYLSGWKEDCNAYA